MINLDTPDGRFIVATCNHVQLEAIQRLMIEAFSVGFKKGAEESSKALFNVYPNRFSDAEKEMIISVAQEIGEQTI
jgi:hypothetical protein